MTSIPYSIAIRLMNTETLFSSKREKRLWFLTGIVVLGIYATLGLAQTWAGILRDRELISTVFWVGLFLIGAAIVVQGVKQRPGGLEIGVWLGIAGVYIIALMRMAIPEERSHLIEYSVVALLVHAALTERVRQGRHVPMPAILAIVITTLIGLLDESIQAIIPSRVFDLFDILFDFLAAVMAVTGSVAIAWARRWGSSKLKGTK